MSRTTVQPEGQSGPSLPAGKRFVPRQIAHFVIYTSRFAESVAWYKTMLGATATYEDDRLAFLSHDDEHHRVFQQLRLEHGPGIFARCCSFDKLLSIS